MRRKTRQALFWICFFVFVVVSPILVLYARGYRFDLAKRKFVATGSIFVKSNPEGAAIFVNGVERGYTPGVLGDVISKPSLISNILPGEHDVRVEKPGYTPWVKKLTVRPRQVTEARSILLFADTRPKTLYFTSITDALVSPDGAHAAVVHEGGATSWIALVNVADPAQQKVLYAQKHQKNEEKNPRLTLEAFSKNGRVLLVKKEVKRSPPSLFTVSSDETANMHVLPKFSGASTAFRKIAFKESGSISILDTRQTLWQWSGVTGEAPARISASAWGFAVHKDLLYTLEGNPQTLFSYTADSTKKTQVGIGSVEESAVPAELFVESLPGGLIVFLAIPEGLTKGTVRLLRGDEKMQDLQKEVEFFQVSPDGKKILTKTWNELWVHYFDDILTQPVHKKGDVLLVARFGTRIKEARWHPLSGDHILYTVPDGLFAIELDDRGGKRNTVELVRNGDIALRSLTRDGLFFTAQEHLALLPWRPKEE